MKTRGYSVGPISILTQIADSKDNSSFWTLIYVRKGSGMYIIEDRLTCLNESDILFIPPGVRSGFSSTDLGDEYNESLDAVIFRFDERWTRSFLDVFHTYGDVMMSLKEMKNAVSIYGPKWMKISSFMNELTSCEPHKEAGIILNLLCLLADAKDTVSITAVSEPAGDIQEKLEKIDRFISCNLMNRFSLEEIAAYAGMNKTYFCLFFKKHYKSGLIEYVNSLKVEKACGLLVNKSLSVSEIAKECGFMNIPYFNRVFKAIKGVSPREFRNDLFIS